MLGIVRNGLAVAGCFVVNRPKYRSKTLILCVDEIIDFVLVVGDGLTVENPNIDGFDTNVVFGVVGIKKLAGRPAYVNVYGFDCFVVHLVAVGTIEFGDKVVVVFVLSHVNGAYVGFVGAIESVGPNCDRFTNTGCFVAVVGLKYVTDLSVVAVVGYLVFDVVDVNTDNGANVEYLI